MSLLSDDNLYISEITRSPTLLAAIVRKAKSGDHHSFEVLHRCFGRLVLSRLRQFELTEEVAEDLHQETFIRAWTRLPELKDDVQISSWLCQIAARLAIDFIRRKQKLSFLPLPVDEAQEYELSEYISTTSPEEQVINAELIELALAQISRASRICIILYAEYGFSQAEIAEMLGITGKGVSAHISRGRKQFRKVYPLLAEGNIPTIEKKGGAKHDGSKRNVL